MPKWKTGILIGFMHALLCMISMGGTAEDWQRLAARIPHVNYGDFLYGRPAWVLEKGKPAWVEAVEAAMADEPGFANLRELAEHFDPKVRTLALMKLYLSGDPQAFRVIHERLKDEGLAFPAVTILSNPIDFNDMIKEREVATAEQKVGHLARSMMEMIAYPRNEDFEAWSKPRLGNPDWLGWYEFLLKRITRGTRPVPEGIGRPLAEFGRLLDQRPPALRAWLGFIVADGAMSEPTEDTVLGTRDELIKAGKVLRPDALLGFLRDGSRAGLREPKVDHPTKGQRFILRHATEFFRVEDAEKLKDMGHFIAAADLRPEMASIWLREACAEWNKSYQSWDRARAMAALLDLRGKNELEFVVNWFYQTESPSSASSDQSVFIKEYRRRAPHDWRKSAEALVAHPGFERINPMDLIYLGLMINDLDGGDTVDKNLLREEHEPDLRIELRRCLGLPANEPVRWIDLTEGSEVVAEWTVDLNGNAGLLAISPDGMTLAIGMRDGKVELRKASDGSKTGEIPANGELATLQYGIADGKLLVFRSNGKMERWNVMPVALENEMKFLHATELCIDPGGDWFATRRANDVGVSVYELKTGEQRWNMKLRIRSFGLIGASPDGTRFAVCDGFNRTVLLFDPEKQEPIARMEGHSGVPEQVAFSADGTTMVTTGSDMKILVWNAKTGERISEFASRQRFPRVQGCDGDSTGFFFGGGIGRLALVDIASGRPLKSLRHKGTWVAALARTEQAVFALVSNKRGTSSLVEWRLPGK